MIYVSGPGHGGPGLVANTYLEGTYSEIYPNITQDEAGPETAVQAVLLPRRHPQPRRPRDPRLHPRGRRARLLALATPSAPPSTIPISSSPASSATARPRPARSPQPGTPTSSSNPVTDGAVLPILHLNGYKIARPDRPRPHPPRRTRAALRRLRLRRPTSSKATTPGHAPADGRDPRQVVDEIRAHPATGPGEGSFEPRARAGP